MDDESPLDEAVRLLEEFPRRCMELHPDGDSSSFELPVKYDERNWGWVA
jgi:hypothetical protein